MSHISARMKSDAAVDVMWRSCFYIALCILVIALFIFVFTIQHLFCIPKSAISANNYSTIRLKHLRSYSTLSVTCASLSLIVSFSDYLVCTQWSCQLNALGFTDTVLCWDAYILSKFFLYLIFIERLFNPHYQRIYQYPQHLRHILWILLLVLVLAMIGINIIAALALEEIYYPFSVDNICNTVYAIADILISLLAMILFFRPLCAQSDTNSNNADTSVLLKYGILSALQLFAALSLQLSLLCATLMLLLDGQILIILKIESGIHLIQMCDCLLLMLCIYIGFARKKTVRFSLIMTSSMTEDNFVSFVLGNVSDMVVL